MDDKQRHPLRDSRLDRSTAEHRQETPQALSPTYRLAFDDPEFLTRPELRPVRLQLELLKPELAMDEAGILSTVVLFGGARIPEPSRRDTARTETLAELSRYYDQARRFARLVTERSLASGGTEDVIVTGGGPGVMEAGNRGADDAGGRSTSLGRSARQTRSSSPPNSAYCLDYFASAKMHIPWMRRRACLLFPGGFGTSTMEPNSSRALTPESRPDADGTHSVLLFGRPSGSRIVNLRGPSPTQGTISPGGRKPRPFPPYVETERRKPSEGDRTPGRRWPSRPKWSFSRRGSGSSACRPTPQDRFPPILPRTLRRRRFSRSSPGRGASPDGLRLLLEPPAPQRARLVPRPRPANPLGQDLLRPATRSRPPFALQPDPPEPPSPARCLPLRREPESSASNRVELRREPRFQPCGSVAHLSDPGCG